MSKRVTLTEQDRKLILEMIESAWRTASVVMTADQLLASKQRLNQLRIKLGFRPLDPKTNQYVDRKDAKNL